MLRRGRGVIPATRPLVEAAEIKDPNWLRGFIEAEGCFQVIVQKREGLATSTGLRFKITQHERDTLLVESLVNYIGCGRYYTVRNRNEVNFMVNIFYDIYTKIIPSLPSSLLSEEEEGYGEIPSTWS